MKADAALTTGAFGSQPRQKLGLLGGELLWRENALLLQFGQPFDLGEYVDFLGSLTTVGFRLHGQDRQRKRVRQVETGLLPRTSAVQVLPSPEPHRRRYG